MPEIFDPTTPDKMFRFHVHDGFLERTIRCLFTSCKQASEHCKAFFPGPEGRDLRGHYCRAVFEKEWKAIGKRARSMDGDAVLNSRGTYYHTRITCGPVILTASHVANPSEIVRDAEFRRTYAQSSQLDLFEERHKPAFDAPLYSILIYGLDNKYAVPVFADVVFPDANCREYVSRIELFREFATLVAKLSNIAIAAADEGDELVKFKETARARKRG